MSYNMNGRIAITRRDGRAGGDSVSRVIQDKIKEIQGNDRRYQTKIATYSLRLVCITVYNPVLFLILGKITLKFRDQEAYYVFSQHEIQENAALIKRLRAEIQEKRLLRQNTMDGDKLVITEGFKNDKESQLAMQRCRAEFLFALSRLT